MKMNNMKTVIKIVAAAILLGTYCACNSNQNREAHEVAETDGAEVWAVLKEEQDEEGELSNSFSLNDIRFANFKTDKDWVDNDYIRTLRSYLDDYTAGAFENPELEPYRKGLKSQFVIYNTEPFLAGGLLVRVFFLEMPDKVFDGWVYSFVDEDTGKVKGYEVRYLTLETEDSGLTKEDILQVVSANPDLKFW